MFPLIASELQSRLPLRNLNWNSSGRPVRSIETLQLDLYPDERTSLLQLPKRSSSLAGPAGFGLQEQPPTAESSESQHQPDTSSQKRERRHQIPGLRQTPYLKIYFLRCDDTETYKNASRKAIREWLKANTPQAQGGATGTQDNHDAFEWMIVHVVLPDPQNNLVWPSKVSANVLDKVRSDFNSSSRGSADHVAQIPATRDLQVQGVTVPGIPTGSAREPFLQECLKAVDDLVGKFKALILTSFDLRVRQYEEDVKEKGSQRNLPGWNFCTFFVLKEGLARGFESVGLLDDAIMGYDELSLELSSALQEEAGKAASGDSNRLFREHTQELLVQAEAALGGKNFGSGWSNYGRFGDSILNPKRKSYRDLILSNNISAFDFRNYVFARQVSLLLRFALQPLSRTTAAPSWPASRNSRSASVLAEVCQRAITFIAELSRTIRQDLKVSFKPEAGSSELALALRHSVLENLIQSYSFALAKQVLAKTEDSSLPAPSDPEFRECIEDEYEEDGGAPLSPKPGPADRPESIKEVQTSQESSDLNLGQSENMAENFSYEKASTIPPGKMPSAIVRLATKRAELLLVARRNLSAIADRNGWSKLLPQFDEPQSEEHMDEIALNNERCREPEDGEHDAGVQVSSSLAGVLDSSMRISLSNEITFLKSFEMLSADAFKLFVLSGDRHSAHTIISDIASLRFRSKDYAAAAHYFQELASFYNETGWVDLEIAVLKMYSYCLKKQGKVEECVRTALRILAQNTSDRNSSHRRTVKDSEVHHELVKSRLDNIEVLVAESRSLKQPIVVDMADYFCNVSVDPFLQHHQENDGFDLVLHLESIFGSAFTADKVKLRIVSMSDGPAKEIWLISQEPTRIETGHCKVDVYCTVSNELDGISTRANIAKTMIPEWYSLDKVILEAGEISLQYHFPHDRNAARDSRDSIPQILLWPSGRALTIQAQMHSLIHLERSKAIYVEIQPGQNEVEAAELTLKSGSAGLRLLTADVEAINGDDQIRDHGRAGTLYLDKLASNSKLGLTVPFKLDADTAEIIIRSEILYTTAHGTYTYGDQHRLSARLPLGVNVQDIFKEHFLFSKFSISTATGLPLSLVGCNLQGSEDFRVVTPYAEGNNLGVFAKQPASMVYRIMPNNKTGKRIAHSKLSMNVDYQCLDEEVAAVIQQSFSEYMKDSPAWKYCKLLQRHLSKILRGRLDHQALEVMGSLKSVQLASYSELDWGPVLTSVWSSERAAVISWLQDWHESNREIALADDARAAGGEFEAPRRRIVIPVEIPSLHVLCTARISTAIPAPGEHYAVGEAIDAKLRIRHSRAWSQQPESSRRPTSFYYELEAPVDTWLIAGARRALFTVTTGQQGDEQVFTMTLLPLRAGRLMLPTLEISLAKEDAQAEEGGPISFEVDYESQGMAILVVPGVSSVTLSVAEDEEGGIKGALTVQGVERRESSGPDSSWKTGGDAAS